jgi:hypothetical protein
MTEDSGAFKTNPANSRQVPAFVMIRGTPLQRSRTGHETLFDMRARHSRRDF